MFQLQSTTSLTHSWNVIGWVQNILLNRSSGSASDSKLKAGTYNPALLLHTVQVHQQRGSASCGWRWGTQGGDRLKGAAEDNRTHHQKQLKQVKVPVNGNELLHISDVMTCRVPPHPQWQIKSSWTFSISSSDILVARGTHAEHVRWQENNIHQMILRTGGRGWNYRWQQLYSYPISGPPRLDKSRSPLFCPWRRYAKNKHLPKMNLICQPSPPHSSGGGGEGKRWPRSRRFAFLRLDGGGAGTAAGGCINSTRQINLIPSSSWHRRRHLLWRENPISSH